MRNRISLILILAFHIHIVTSFKVLSQGQRKNKEGLAKLENFLNDLGLYTDRVKSGRHHDDTDEDKLQSSPSIRNSHHRTMKIPDKSQNKTHQDTEDKTIANSADLKQKEATGIAEGSTGEDLSSRNFKCGRTSDCVNKHGLMHSNCIDGVCHVKKFCKTDDDCSKSFKCLPDGNGSHMICMRKKKSRGTKKEQCHDNSDCSPGFDCITDVSDNSKSCKYTIKKDLSSSNNCSAQIEELLEAAVTEARSRMDRQLRRALEAIKKIIREKKLT